MGGPSGAGAVSGRRRYRAPAILMLLLHLAGCTTMRPIEGPYAATLPASAPERVRVTTSTGDRLTIREPRIEDDVLSGELLDDRNRRTEIRWSSPLAQVQAIEVSETNTALTALAVGVGVVLGLFAIGVAAVAAECRNGC
jgi:hypothetical protein